MNIVPIGSDGPGDMLDVLDRVRESATKGTTTAFAIVEIRPDEVVRYSYASAGRMTWLRLLGAISALLADAQRQSA